MKFFRFALGCVVCASLAFCSDSEGGSDSGSGDAMVGDYPVSSEIVSIPLPPEGQRWIVNESLSDEFNDGVLDDTKWLDYHDSWDGREPGLFEPKMVSFNDTCMVLSGEYMDEPVEVWNWNNTSSTTYYISCAAVISKLQNAHYGYYECRFKANKTTLSSTFWMSSRGTAGTFSTEGRQPEGSDVGTFSQELDICECIGRNGDFSGTAFADRMNANIHYWMTPTDGSKEDRKPASTLLYIEDGSKPSDDYNIYGCWWRDKSNATFYLNNGQATDREFIDTNLGTGAFYFTEPMGVNMVVETYSYPWIELPTEEELSDPTLNSTYYDWIRSYVLVDADMLYNADAKTMVMFDNLIHFSEKPETLTVNDEGNIEVNVTYTLSDNAYMRLVIYDSKKQLVSESVKRVYAGYANMVCEIEAPETSGSGMHVVGYLLPQMTSETSEAYQGDSFEFSL
ncbi:MAG: hypothetical protein SNH01_03865 [Rikenellaceae bacterium]